MTGNGGRGNGWDMGTMGWFYLLKFVVLDSEKSRNEWSGMVRKVEGID